MRTESFFHRKEGVQTVFEELMPLLTQRVLIVTLSRVSDEQMCVNVIPKPLKSDQQDDGAALTTPLSVTGTPKELDQQLPQHLVEFVETRLGLSSTLKSAKEQMEDAAKVAREARKSTNSKSQNGSNRNAHRSPAKRNQRLTRRKTQMIQDQHPSIPSHRMLASDLTLVPETCSTLKRRTTSETCCPIVLTHHPGKGAVMEVHRMERKFVYNGVKLPDTTPTITPEQVRE